MAQPPELDPTLAAIFARAMADYQAKQKAQEALTVRELYDGWQNALLGVRAKSARSHRSYLDIAVRDSMSGETFCLGDLKWTDCTHNRLVDWIKRLATQKSTRKESVLLPGYRQQVRNSVGAAFNYHLRLGHITRNPLAGVPGEKDADNGRDGYFDPDSLEKFLPFCHPLLSVLLRIMARCGGLRISEAISLRKDQIDHSTREFLVKNKGGGMKRVIVPDDAYDLVCRQVAVAPGEYVFPHPSDPKGNAVKYTTVAKWMEKARDKAGMRLLGELPVLHHARHGFSMAMLDKGAPLNWVAEQLGHSDIKMLSKRYGKLRGQARETMRGYMNASPLVGEKSPHVASYPCPICKASYPGPREAAACLDKHEAAGAVAKKPASPVIPIASFERAASPTSRKL